LADRAIDPEARVIAGQVEKGRRVVQHRETAFLMVLSSPTPRSQVTRYRPAG
jgi:hypothetical protein